MKSAYEKAMERLERESGPVRKLSDEQRARIAEIDRKYDAQIAEQKLAHQGKLAGVRTQAEYDGLQAELAGTLSSLESRREREKESVWGEVPPSAE